MNSNSLSPSKVALARIQGQASCGYESIGANPYRFGINPCSPLKQKSLKPGVGNHHKILGNTGNRALPDGSSDDIENDNDIESKDDVFGLGKTRIANMHNIVMTMQQNQMNDRAGRSFIYRAWEWLEDMYYELKRRYMGFTVEFILLPFWGVKFTVNNM